MSPLTPLSDLKLIAQELYEVEVVSESNGQHQISSTSTHLFPVALEHLQIFSIYSILQQRVLHFAYAQYKEISNLNHNNSSNLYLISIF